MLEPIPEIPRQEYLRRLEARHGLARWKAGQERLVSNARLVVFAVGVVMAWLVAGPEILSTVWLLAPLAVFLALMVVHERIIQARERAEGAAVVYERGLARLEDRWAGGGATGERFLQEDERHPYAADLDLFGKGSLFELLSTVRTRAGELTLAGWLRSPARLEEIAARQVAVRELAPRLDLREALGLFGDQVGPSVDPDVLADWAEVPTRLSARSLRAAALLLSSLTVLALGFHLFAGGGTLPFYFALTAQIALAMALRGRVRAVIAGVDRPGRELGRAALMLDRIERERFDSSLLRSLQQKLGSEGAPPASRCIARLARLIELLDGRRNQLFAPFAALVLWATQIAFAIESWRALHGRHVARWFAALGEIEALAAFAAYAYEHPEDAFPELREGEPAFAAEGLGHPLLPRARLVRNDLRLSGEQALLIVSGSNMSGKTTLLRSVGVNAVLALAGAPVRARKLSLCRLSVGASIRLNDSLQEGVSRFYAEITRLRQIVELTDGRLPVLFLLDEILQGTNSHDRRIGAEGLVRGLVERGAIGLITTHDLALAHIAETLAPRAANVHFEDHLEGDEMRFDYRLRPGVVQKRNALALMRAIGLPV
jgi:hypothetical protein